MLLRLIASASAVLALSGCSSNNEMSASDEVYCIAYAEPETKVVFTNGDAKKFEEATGSKPSCHLMYAAQYNPGANNLGHKANQMELEIKRLEERVEELEVSSPTQEK